jgi:type IV secretion system protein TrbL
MYVPNIIQGALVSRGMEAVRYSGQAASLAAGGAFFAACAGFAAA